MPPDKLHRSLHAKVSPAAPGAMEQVVIYRPDIDGLRAVAVIAVVAFHAAPNWLPGGFAGVDVFFVISGFLITGILLRNAGAREHLLQFFKRRIRRIFPALIAVLSTTLLLGWYLLLPDEFLRLTRHVAAAALFVVNFEFVREAGYFDAIAEWKPLLHLWSIAVEEQFYLFWPFLLAWTVAKQRLLPWVVTALMVVSFLLNIAMVTQHGPATYLLLPTRLWELMAGGWLWWLLLRNPRLADNPSTGMRDTLAFAGLAIIVMGFVFLSPQRHYPGAWALLPVVGTCCVIAAGDRAWVNRTLLGHRWVVFIGLISYPLYLWHWPALAFLRIVEGGAIGVVWTCIALAASFALAVATFFWIERPLRRSRHGAFPWALVAAMAVIGATGWAGSQGFIQARAHGEGFERFNEAARDWDFPGRAFRSWTTANDVRVTSVGAGSHQILFFGDSNAQQYGPRMEEVVLTHPEANAQVFFATKGGCPPIPGIRREMSPECTGFADKVLAFARDSSVSDVVFVAQWTGYLDTRSLVFVRNDGTLVRGDAALEPVLEQFAVIIRDLTMRGKKVYFVANIPVGREMDPRYVLHRQWSGDLEVRSQGIDREVWEQGIKNTVSRLAQAALGAGATVIDPADELCGPKVCRSVTSDGEPMYRDGFHLRATYMRERVHYLDRIVLAP